MKTYEITFITSSSQAVPYSKEIKANNPAEAKNDLRAEAQIPARFILSCKKI